MKDLRAIICGILSGIALIGAIVLAGIGAPAVHVGAAFTVASTFGAYVVGLYSSPRSDV